ncbi:dihydroorotase [Kiloniella sp. b19]|uniref:dihydroorotase n=1 Tax=Kiloniella sp. GXU_MW_B19 TaxID=3141326 RepID=UPI0031E0CBD6
MENTIKKRVFVNARLLDPSSDLDSPGGILCEHGKIVDLGSHITAETAPEGIEIIDCDGLCLAPGLVDMRVYLGEPGGEHKESIRTASEAAAAGGITTMVAMPDTTPVLDDISGVEYIARRARETRMTKIHCHGALTRGLEGKEITEIGLLSDYGAVAFTDGLKAVKNAQTLRRALSYATAFNKVIIQHPSEPSLSGGVMNGGEIATRMGLSGIPALAEVMMIERDLRLVEMTGARYHIANVSTAESVRVIREAKARGLTVTCDTAPHYFTLNEQSVIDYRTFAKVFPPLRSEEDRLAVYEGVVDGTIDIITSDHCPQDQDSKRLPFAQAEFGIVGLETLLPLSLQFFQKGDLSLLEVLRRITVAPSRLLGLETGTLGAGAAADFVLFNPDRPHFIDPLKFRSKSKNSPFTGYPVQGQVNRSVVDARDIFVL